MADPAPNASLHPLHRLWQTLPAGLRRAAWARAAAMRAPRPDAVAPAASGGIAVCGEWRRESGLGEGARLMHAGLASLGVPTWLLDVAVRLPGDPASDIGDMPPDGVPLVIHVNAPLLPAALRSLPRFALRGRRIIGYWAWELPTVPHAWRQGIGFVHEIWVPSHFTAAAIETVAPPAMPIRVVQHPVAAAPPRPSSLRRADFGLSDDAFVVLTSFSLASSFERKNPLAAIGAFRAAFADSARHVLVLKLSHVAHYGADVAQLRAAIAGASNIILETRTLPPADNHALTACADAVLSLHRSEGFGLVPAEAMLLGKPVVATDWSATAEFIDATCGMPVPYKLIPALDPRGVFQAPGAVWAQADIGAAALALRRLADDSALRRRLGEAARVAACARLGTAALAEAARALGLAVPHKAAA